MKRKGKEKGQKSIWSRLFLSILIICAIAIPLLCGFFIDFAQNVDKRPDHMAVERMLTRNAMTPPAGRDWSLESEIEYEGLKETLFKVVEDSEISNVLDDHRIVLVSEPHFCGLGRSINFVSTNTPFTEVVQRYNTWAANNDWHHVDSAEDDRLHIYRNSRKAWKYRTTLTIRSFAPALHVYVSARVNPFLATHYQLELLYIDPLCGQRNIQAE